MKYYLLLIPKNCFMGVTPAMYKVKQPFLSVYEIPLLKLIWEIAMEANIKNIRKIIFDNLKIELFKVADTLKNMLDASFIINWVPLNETTLEIAWFRVRIYYASTCSPDLMPSDFFLFPVFRRMLACKKLPRLRSICKRKRYHKVERSL